MSSNGFFDDAAPLEASPVVAVFPLTGTLLLPGNYLPLNVFEERYRHLVEDALADGGLIGLIQPVTPQADQWGEGESEPELYGIGCAGRLESAERQPDGRYLIVLEGVARFAVLGELQQRRGYRRVRARFLADAEDAAESLEPLRLLAAVKAYAGRHHLEFDMDLLASLDPVRLLNALCAALPFAPAERQALLEADTGPERQRALLDLMRMDESASAASDETYAPPMVH